MKTRKHLSMIVIILSVLLFYSGTTRATDFYVVKEKWVSRYNGTMDDYDGAYAITTDTSGNVYVTGHCDGYGFPSAADYATIKYDANGNELWVAKYNGPADSADMAYAITRDTSGNVYVTGGSEGQHMMSRNDYATIKYDANGNELWVARYNGPQDGRDTATCIQVDESGNVYVAGSSMSSQTVMVYDYATIKYDPNGNELWTARYNGPGNSSDGLRDIALDTYGNIYVTGRSKSSGTGYDYATIKYDPNGNQVWVARYDGPGHDSEEVVAIAIDKAGNICVGGFSENSCGDWDYAVVKYDPNGNELWVARHDWHGPDDNFDFAKDMAIDLAGNIYVTGYCNGQNVDSEYATIKFDPNGNELWTARYAGPNDIDVAGCRALAIAVDNQGNGYVTGYVTTWTWEEGYVRNYTTIKYDPNGNVVWVIKYDGPADSDHASAIAIDDNNNVYVTGESVGSDTSYDYATIKYAQPFCSTPINADLNNDCKVTFLDFALMARNWLECNLEPSSECWD